MNDKQKLALKAALAVGAGLVIWAICVAIDLSAGDFLGVTEHFATCDNGWEIYSLNYGAMMSYRYEVRNGILVLKSGLTRAGLDEYEKENGLNCRIDGRQWLGG